MTETTPQKTLKVDLGERSYPIHIGRGLLERVGQLIADYSKSKRVAVVTDETVFDLHGHTLTSALSDYAVTWIIRPAGEAQKQLSVIEDVLDALFQAKFDRSDLLLAFGGGVIGDLAGFSASLYKRGMPFVQIPTTLLAQVDSSVGGKTGINNKYGKNLVGAFYQPQAVIADTDVLSTLPLREVKAGYAEVLKYGLLGDQGFFEWLDAEGGANILNLEPDALTHAIAISCDTKARIVAQDEREGGIRALLNLGHSFAHALELDAGYDGNLLHGEAVSVGMDMAFAYSAAHGFCDNTQALKVSTHLKRLEMPCIETQTARFSKAAKLTDLMGQDKKNEDGKITLILTRAIGDAFVQKSVKDTDVEAFLSTLA